ncbi:pumilio domain member 6 [Saccharomyces pastorianus]|uniref:Pumilio domain member 6 n=1 Tax=Saccharomyces pastorianus TaxID=27292 RepID=A0A6C1E498_SACPS|nr:pumilio domain member 6 [Saccharomyces pastorianus]
MAPVTKKTNGKRSARGVSQSDKKSTKKPRISIDSSDEELELAKNEDAELSSSDEDDLDDLDKGKPEGEKKEEDKEADDLDISDDDEDEDEEKEGKSKSEGGEGGNHTEQRKLLKERKMQRRSGTQVQQIKSVWERLRVKTPPLPKQIREKLSNEIWELSKDCISDLVLKHDASRIVQTLVKYSSKERREQIVDSLKGKFYVLATSAYGKYLLVKLLHYGSRTSRQAIINELHGSLRKLMRHREGAYVVEDLFVLYATHEQKQQMIKEFWGSEYAVFRETHKDLTIQKVCESSVEKRNIIARNLIGTITASVDKGSTGFQILHAAMREYVKIANEKEISEMIELLHEQFAELVHTPEGSDVACTLMAKANAKERKLILKTLKNHGEKLIKNEHGNIVFITILNCVDDTVLVFKSFSPTVKDNLQEFIIDKFGRRPWLYILLGLDGKYFSPIVKNELLRYIELSEATSKKDPLQRRHELLSKFAPMFLSTISKNYAEILTENLGCQFVAEVLINDELYAQLNEKDQQKYQTVLDNILTTFKGDITEETHPIHRAFSTRLLKALIQGGKWNNKERKVEPLKNVQGLGVPFAYKLYDEIIDSSNLLEWINNADSSFTIVALYETLKDQKEGKQFLKDLKEVQSKITSDENNKGSHLLVKLLK